MVSTNRGQKRKGEETTTIRVKLSTKKALEKEGVFGETHDSIIRKVLDMHKSKKEVVIC